MISRIIIKNYKGLEDANVVFRNGLNIVVGDNEVGKSTLLEAINLGLTGQLNRRSARYELHPFLFHANATKRYLDGLAGSPHTSPPEILIEIYLQDRDEYADLIGQNNSRFENCPGVKLRIALDERFSDEYAACLAEKDRMTMVPVDYFGIFWESFANNPVDLRSMPVRPVLIDPGSVTNTFAANRYVVEIARDFLSPEQQAQLGLSYRAMRDLFRDDSSIQAINRRLESETGVVTNKKLSVALDMTAKASWETSVQPHLDDLPMSQVGKGEQNAIKIKLALKSSEDREVVLIEEPENHLSHTNLNKLISDIQDNANGRQLIVSTHSSFVLNKLGVENTLMFNGAIARRLSDLTADTTAYFQKLPGHDTLRMLLARKSILVEGASDELVVQKAYQQVYAKTPLSDGVEVIAVNSLAFKRFLEIAQHLSLNVVVVTDNDGDAGNVAAKYADFADDANIRVCFSHDTSLPTLEPQIVAVNDLQKMNTILGRTDANRETLLGWMSKNKADAAFKMAVSTEEIEIPEYIRDAITE
jgi:predicted ATPase